MDKEQTVEVEDEETKQVKSLSRFVYTILVTFAVVFIWGIFFGRIVYFPIKVKGVSMQPTLNALASSEYDTAHQDTAYLASVRNVARGDIIVFDASNYASVSEDEKLFIKRAIGLPGDKIYFATNGTEKNGKIYYDIYVNGVKIEETYTKEPMWYQPLHTSIPESTFFADYVLTNKEISLGPNEFFLMGDNRNNSIDSRFLGVIKKSDFVGKVVLQIKSNETIFKALIDKIF